MQGSQTLDWSKTTSFFRVRSQSRFKYPNSIYTSPVAHDGSSISKSKAISRAKLQSILSKEDIDVIYKSISTTSIATIGDRNLAYPSLTTVKMEHQTNPVNKNIQTEMSPPDRPPTQGVSQRQRAEDEQMLNAYQNSNGRHSVRIQNLDKANGRSQQNQQFQEMPIIDTTPLQFNQGHHESQIPRNHQMLQQNIQQQQFQAPYPAPYPFPNTPNQTIQSQFTPHPPHYQQQPQRPQQNLHQCYAAPSAHSYNPMPQLEKVIVRHPLHFPDLTFDDVLYHHPRTECRINPYTGQKETYTVRQALIRAVPRGHPLYNGTYNVPIGDPLYGRRFSKHVLQLGGKPDLQLVDMDYFPGETPEFVAWCHPDNPRQLFYAENAPPVEAHLAQQHPPGFSQLIDPNLNQPPQLQQPPQPQQLPTPHQTPNSSNVATRTGSQTLFEYFCKTCQLQLQYGDGVWDLDLAAALCHQCQALENRPDAKLVSFEAIDEQKSLIVARNAAEEAQRML